MSEEVELSRYVTNGEWVLTKYQIVRNEVVYPISSAIYPDVTGAYSEYHNKVCVCFTVTAMVAILESALPSEIQTSQPFRAVGLGSMQLAV